MHFDVKSNSKEFSLSLSLSFLHDVPFLDGNKINLKGF
jgi:hypothetical protein